MRALAVLIAFCAMLLAGLAPARAEKLVSTLSNQDISITSSFDGELLTLFGNVEPETGSGQKYVEGPFHIVIVISGPHGSRVARRKSNVLGIWLNTQQVMFEDFPSFFHVLSSDKLADIADPSLLATEGILPASQARHSAQANWWTSMVFGRELVRLMTEKGLFGLEENAVGFLSETAYKASIALPSNVPNGTFVARTYLFKNGELVGKRSEGFLVRKTGFERFLGSASRDYPLLYGLTCVILALFTGWLGGVVFKR